MMKVILQNDRGQNHSYDNVFCIRKTGNGYIEITGELSCGEEFTEGYDALHWDIVSANTDNEQ
jgi:hypothetical protein